MSDPTPSTTAPRRDDILTLRIDRAAFEGKSVARSDGFVIFVEGAVPGDLVQARVLRRKKRHADAVVVELLEASPLRTEPLCAHFGVCGGCAWQHMAYPHQCEWKRTQVHEAFVRLGGFPDVTVEAAIAAEQPFYYRNKMEFSFAERRWLLPHELGAAAVDEPFALGLHVPGRWDKVLRIDACHLQSTESSAILTATREYFEQSGERAWSAETETGSLRHLIIREGKRTGERMVVLVTAGLPPEVVRGYAALLTDERFGITTLVHGVSRRKAQVAHFDSGEVLFGPGIITERLGTRMYEISPASFFQSNTAQAERLYDTAVAAAALRPDDLVWDLYCGIGTISLHIAGCVREVVGVELNPAAVADAEANAARNSVKNAHFVAADIAAFAARAAAGEMDRPDVIILDPPRSGLHPSIPSALAGLGTDRIVYVSCNPATCARDCRMFADLGYDIERIVPVDMFPQTYHIECVVRLSRRITE